MSVSAEDARRVGDALGIDPGVVPPEIFRRALEIELEHADVTEGDLETTGRIALAHLKEFPDYYQRLIPMERQAEQDWAGKAKPSPVLGGGLRRLTLFLATAAIIVVLVLIVVLSVRKLRAVGKSYGHAARLEYGHTAGTVRSI